jgi:hypothetical protein
MIASNQELEVFADIKNIFCYQIHIVKVKLTLAYLYGNNIIAYKNISLWKLDQCMDNLTWVITIKNEKVYIT